MSHLSLPDVLLARLLASMPPEHLLGAVESCLARDNVTVPLEVPVLHEGTLRVPPLQRVARADPVPGAERAALGGLHAAAVVYSGFPEVLMRAALWPVGLGCAQPDRFLRASACQALKRAEVLIQSGVELRKYSRQLILQQPALGLPTGLLCIVITDSGDIQCRTKCKTRTLQFMRIRNSHS